MQAPSLTCVFRVTATLVHCVKACEGALVPCDPSSPTGRFVCRSTVEERIQLLQRKKLELSEAVLSG